ncbi:energy-coupling factor transporter ATPase [Paenibacillus polygoni]|uniref:Energy-coupling factor transporter ATPase n=1 Tax=Paenibacillus polygoni TaxID=3050112 RepID=A0ABY8WZB2_9BACL|nr:energy-coupling factor transporter ATPase [Paenibacillus polygoni]WIV17502.1 energy-coupling factor transporter ATPase [Paenibacillus polygoni]
MLIFDHVHFYYQQEHPILDDLSFTIEPGEFVAMVGANGCGKSTVAKLMDGLLLPKQGHVTFGNLETSNPEDLVSIHEKIGIVFQNPEDQFITTTVLDEILFGLQNIRVPREEMDQRVEEALHMVHMEDYKEAMPHHLSGGQKQRVAIAAILAMRPQIIIFDEATSMLDPEGREQVMKIMKELHRQGMTIIHITHHMDEVLFAKRLLLLHEGRIEFDGEPATFFETVNVTDYQLEKPFSVRLHQNLHLNTPLTADWKEMIRSEWNAN